MNLIETYSLKFGYGSDEILQGIDLCIPQGSIYGYLGKNGAGKSTTIQLLLGLLTPSYGKLLIFERGFEAHRTTILERVGCIIDTPSFYSHMTAHENMKYHAICRHCDSTAIAKALDTVALSSVDCKKKVKYFSTGMKQRLGIAIALLHDPDLLILDEPLNGLDAEGIVEIRELLKTLQRAGKTIFLSSHILSEIEKTCSHVGIINDGRLIFQGAMEELLKTVEISALLKVDRPIQAMELCRQHGFAVEICHSKVVDVNLEDIFLTLIK